MPVESLHAAPTAEPSYTAFDGVRAIGSGTARDVAHAAKLAVDAGARGPMLVVNNATSEPLELDLRGTLDDVLAHFPAPSIVADTQSTTDTDADTKPSRGRPKLGVVPREITLLPRHWEWLGSQPGGASVTLRKLVEQARLTSGGKDRRRHAQESTYRFMSAMLGNQPGFEEATRALFAADASRFAQYAAPWPTELREHVTRLAAAVFHEQDAHHA